MNQKIPSSEEQIILCCNISILARMSLYASENTKKKKKKVTLFLKEQYYQISKLITKYGIIYMLRVQCFSSLPRKIP